MFPNEFSLNSLSIICFLMSVIITQRAAVSAVFTPPTCPKMPPTSDKSACDQCVTILNHQSHCATTKMVAAFKALDSGCKRIGSKSFAYIDKGKVHPHGNGAADELAGSNGLKKKCDAEIGKHVRAIALSLAKFQTGLICQYACSSDTEPPPPSAYSPNITVPIMEPSANHSSEEGQPKGGSKYYKCLAVLQAKKDEAIIRLQEARDLLRVGCDAVDIMVDGPCRRQTHDASDGMNLAADSIHPEQICKG